VTVFSELYGAYYNAVAAILRAACDHPLRLGELRAVLAQKAFGESALAIEPALREERWQLLSPDGTTPLRHAPTLPLTLLERRWLKAIALDPRIRLFPGEIPDDPGVEPLFSPRDFEVFDRYRDGDPFTDEEYIRNFRLILEAIRTRTPLTIDARNRKGSVIRRTLLPEYLEYSEKDDKFRLIGSADRFGSTVNLGRILRCEKSGAPIDPETVRPVQRERRTVVLELYDRRNALERVLMHFAHFEKEAERLGEDRYRLTVTYDKDDETEMVIRVLSFGPMVRAVAPEHFTALIRDRLIRQKSCGL